MPPDSTYRVETPENVELHFELAGPGSRFCALCIDGLLVSVAGLVIVLLAVLAGVTLPSLFESDGARALKSGTMSVFFALVVVALAILTSAYHGIFELFMRGQTPGKRAMKIRAISDDGTAMSPSQVLVRNVLRTIDFLPGMYGVGGLVALFSPTSKRLGDLAASTIVVKEAELDYQAATDVRKRPPPVVEVAATAVLSAEETRIVRSFLERRPELLPDARARIGEDLASRLAEKYGGPVGDAETYLERLLQGGAG
ncbi:MAG TPA: RDD family protein [Polyangiaceae bacterium]|nr:RDD family protein [Polyangiaceae bacterium]